VTTTRIKGVGHNRTRSAKNTMGGKEFNKRNQKRASIRKKRGEEKKGNAGGSGGRERGELCNRWDEKRIGEKVGSKTNSSPGTNTDLKKMSENIGRGRKKGMYNSGVAMSFTPVLKRGNRWKVVPPHLNKEKTPEKRSA